jgi:hypothetical protein
MACLSKQAGLLDLEVRRQYCGELTFSIEPRLRERSRYATGACGLQAAGHSQPKHTNRPEQSGLEDPGLVRSNYLHRISCLVGVCCPSASRYAILPSDDLLSILQDCGPNY